jgi:16S rRNA (guanine966-N2)-methyltransferase
MPVGASTRPTADRTREGLFSTIESVLGGLSGRSFLDLYAGSGAVGLEAASRGAAPVVLVERDQGALKAARANVASLGLAEVTIRAQPVAVVLAGEPDRQFEVVFADPPYADPVDSVLAQLVSGGWLTRDALVCLERATRSEPLSWPDGLDGVKSRRYGDSTLWYGRRS